MSVGMMVPSVPMYVVSDVVMSLCMHVLPSFVSYFFRCLVCFVNVVMYSYLVMYVCRPASSSFVPSLCISLWFVSYVFVHSVISFVVSFDMYVLSSFMYVCLSLLSYIAILYLFRVFGISLALVDSVSSLFSSLVI